MNQMDNEEIAIEFPNNNTFNLEAIFTILLLFFCVIWAFYESISVGFAVLGTGLLAGSIFLFFELRNHKRKKLIDTILISKEGVWIKKMHDYSEPVDFPTTCLKFDAIKKIEIKKNYGFVNILRFHYFDGAVDNIFTYKPPLITKLKKDQWQILISELNKRIVK